MEEKPVFWLRGTRGKSNPDGPQPPEAARYEPAIRDVCAACGYDVKNYFAAFGDFDSWLVHMERDGRKYRVFWNGKSTQLTLEQAHPSGWEELLAATQDNSGLPGFVTGLKALLGAPRTE